MTANFSGLNATSNFVVIKPVSPEEKSKGGILLVNDTTVRNKGRIVHIGADAFKEWNSPPAVDERVLFVAYKTAERGADGEEYFIVADSDIVAIL